LELKEKCKYSVNEDLINKAGMKVNSNMLFQAVNQGGLGNLFGKARTDCNTQILFVSNWND